MLVMVMLVYQDVQARSLHKADVAATLRQLIDTKHPLNSQRSARSRRGLFGGNIGGAIGGLVEGVVESIGQGDGLPLPPLDIISQSVCTDEVQAVPEISETCETIIALEGQIDDAIQMILSQLGTAPIQQLLADASTFVNSVQATICSLDLPEPPLFCLDAPSDTE